MKMYYITFRSVTWAQRGEKLLNENRYRCQLRRTPRWMEEKGCGYCLQMMLGDIRPPVQLLRGAGLPLRKVYVQEADGGMTEVVV